MKKIGIICGLVITLLGGYIIGKYERPIKRFFIPPTVSVVMSTYNRASALPTAIDSILNQTYRDFEFIIINDGSKDETDEIIRSCARRDDRIIYLNNPENKGLIYSLNRGLDKARGKYIARMDDDDKSVLSRLERQVLAMDRNPQITILGTHIIGRDTMPKRHTGNPEVDNPDQVQLNSYFSSALAHPTIMIRAQFLKDNQIRYDENNLYAEDCGLYKDVLNKGGKISTLREGLLHFGYTKNMKHPDNYSHIQSETFKRIQKEKLAPFFDAPYEMLGAFKGIENRCEILKKMVQANPEKKIVNQELLEKMQEEVCSRAADISKAITVDHPYWNDYILVADDGTFFRLDARSETGKVEKNPDQTVTLRWTNWDPEIYRVLDEKHYTYLRDFDGKVKEDN